MILTNCAACAAPLAHDAPECLRCETRYCSYACKRNHAIRGGHGNDKCAEIARGGGAEQYHADEKYEEAVADAVEECADDTEGQTCYICLEGGSEEGLVRMCACRGASGFAHVSCLARQAKVLMAEAEERDLDNDARRERWKRWYECRLCEQRFHGVVACALGWACWKTYVGRPEEDWARSDAIGVLWYGLHEAERHEDALTVGEAWLSTVRRIGDEDELFAVQGNLAATYEELGRDEEALRMRQDVYSGRLKLLGEDHRDTLIEASNYANSLLNLQRFEEARSLLRKSIPVARRILGESHIDTLRMRGSYAEALYTDPGATLDHLREAVTMLEDAERIARRVFGGAHPIVDTSELSLREARAALRARETPPSGSA